MKRMLLILLGALLLSGCSTYRLSGERKEAIVDKISPNTITVTFCGNAYMDRKEVEKYALQRASQEALAKGWDYFVVVNRKDNSKICALGSGKDRSLANDALPAENSNYLASLDFVEPNITLTIQRIGKGEKIPEDAIDAQKYLKENFPGLQK